jgi:hypothetical protein
VNDEEELHHAAVFAAIEAQIPDAVYEIGEVPAPAPSRYAVVVSSPGDWEQVRFTADKAALRSTHTVYCVGDDAKAARWVARRVRVALKDVRLTIAGRHVFRPDPWISRPIALERDGLYPLPFGVIQFDLLSEPA